MGRGLIEPFLAGQDIPAYRLVTSANGVDGIVVAGHTATDTLTLLAGVSTELATTSGGIADVTVQGVAEVQLGGTVKKFDVLTNDSNGKAVKATADTVSLKQTVGMALMDGVSGDVINVLVNQGRLEKI